MRIFKITLLLTVVIVCSYAYAGSTDVPGGNTAAIDMLYAINEGDAQNQEAAESQDKERQEKIRRLDEIDNRKLELQSERAALIKERAQLMQDINSAGMVRTQEKLDRFKERLSSLEKKLIQFNKEVDTLNEEEKQIMDELEKSN